MTTPMRYVRTIRPQSRPFRRNPSRGLFGASQSSFRGRSRDHLKVLAAIAAVVAVAAVAWSVVWSPLFRIKEVAVNGATPATEAEMRRIVGDVRAGRRLLVFPQDNVLFFDPDACRAAIGERFYLAELAITRRLSGSIIIGVKEKVTAAAWLSAGRFFALDARGDIIREMSPDEILRLRDLPSGYVSASISEMDADSMSAPEVGPAAAPNLPAQEPANPVPLILGDETAGPTGGLKIGDNALPPELAGLAIEAHNRLGQAAGARIRWFVARSSRDSLEAVMDGGWRVVLTGALPFETQAARLSLVLREKIGARLPELDYVDLRYDERIFFRFKDAAD